MEELKYLLKHLERMGWNFNMEAKEKKLTKVFFDRGIYKYHGRIKIFAETLRKNGMEF